MIIIGIICLVFLLIVVVPFHDDLSYKSMYERQKVNSMHPDWKPYCGINYLERDPQWFIDNGYEKWVR